MCNQLCTLKTNDCDKMESGHFIVTTVLRVTLFRICVWVSRLVHSLTYDLLLK